MGRAIAIATPFFFALIGLEFAWGRLRGRNTYRLEVYDSASGGCRDGVGPGGLNENQGAESTLVFLQALLAITGADLGRLVGSPA